MRLNYTIPFAFLLFSVFATAQSSKPEILWEKSYGGNEDDEFRSMEITDDGGFICTGYTISSNGDVDSTHGGADCWVVKFDSTGKIEWQRTYGGSSADWGRSISKTSDGGYIIAGYSKSNDGDISGNHGDFDFLIMKLNSSGNIEWQKSFGGSNFENAYRAIETYDGKFVVIGFTESNDGNVSGNHGGQDFWILKLNGNGDVLWKKTLGGSDNEQASCVIETEDHDYAIIGFSSSDDNGINDHKGARDVWVVKISASGRLLWKKSYGGTNDDEGRWMEETPDHGFLLFGYSTSTDMDVTTNNGGEDFWVIKTNANGDIEWQRSYGGSLDEYPYYGHRCSDGTILVAGISNSDDYDATEHKGNGDYWIIRLDADGNLLWEKSFGGAKIDVARCSTPTSEGEMLIAGYSLSHNGDISNYYKNYVG